MIGPRHGVDVPAGAVDLAREIGSGHTVGLEEHVLDEVSQSLAALGIIDGPRADPEIERDHGSGAHLADDDADTIVESLGVDICGAS